MNASSRTDTHERCPCSSGEAYTGCCGRFHRGAVPDTAEQLMRSRYTAFVFGLSDYLLETWHPSTRPTELDLNRDIRWLGLKIKHCIEGQSGQYRGTVEFVARSKLGGRAQRLHEISRFVREHDRWWYLDGKSGKDA